MSKDLFFWITHAKWKWKFVRINKRKIKSFFLYFSRKYEAHKAVFSTKETNLLGRGYRISFQKKIFRHFTKKPKLNYVSTFIYDNAKNKFYGFELKLRIILTKTSKSDSKQANKPQWKNSENGTVYKVWTKKNLNMKFFKDLPQCAEGHCTKAS